MNAKVCIDCKQKKSLSDFAIHKNGKYKRGSYCKQCACKRVRDYRILCKTDLSKRHLYDARLEYHKNWKRSHPEIARRIMKKRRMNITVRVNDSMSCAIRNSLIRGSKGGKRWFDLCGYSVCELKKHLEKQFTKEMTWENYGAYWHIDHIIPKTAFNFKTSQDVDFKRCWSLKNLQPLEKIENIKKHARVDKPFQPSLAITI